MLRIFSKNFSFRFISHVWPESDNQIKVNSKTVDIKVQLLIGSGETLLYNYHIWGEMKVGSTDFGVKWTHTDGRGLGWVVDEKRSSGLTNNVHVWSSAGRGGGDWRGVQESTRGGGEEGDQNGHWHWLRPPLLPASSKRRRGRTPTTAAAAPSGVSWLPPPFCLLLLFLHHSFLHTHNRRLHKRGG